MQYQKKCYIGELKTVHTYVYIVLAKKFVQVFPKDKHGKIQANVLDKLIQLYRHGTADLQAIPHPKNRLENKISQRELKLKINSRVCEKPP